MSVIAIYKAIDILPTNYDYLNISDNCTGSNSSQAFSQKQGTHSSFTLIIQWDGYPALQGRSGREAETVNGCWRGCTRGTAFLHVHPTHHLLFRQLIQLKQQNKVIEFRRIQTHALRFVMDRSILLDHRGRYKTGICILKLQKQYLHTAFLDICLELPVELRPG